MNIQQTIRRVLREESGKQSRLLSTIEQDGLYQVLQDTGLSIKQIISKTGELPREVLEGYIKDSIENEAQSMSGSGGDKGLVFPIPLSKNKDIESFYLSKGVVTVEIKEYSNGRVVAGSYEKIKNLSYDEIYKIVKEFIEWGKDIYYEI